MTTSNEHSFPNQAQADEVIRCCNCGATLRPRDAESFDGRALSESARLGHRDSAICEAVREVRAMYAGTGKVHFDQVTGQSQRSTPNGLARPNDTRRDR